MLRYKNNHLHVEIKTTSEIYLARSQLVKLHRNLFHSSAAKLFKLFQRARIEEASPEIVKKLQGILKRFNPFHRIQTAPHAL